MLTADPQTLGTARLAKEELLAQVFGVQAQTVGPAVLTNVIPASSNIVGVGYGAKVTSGAALDETAVRVYVRAKMASADVPASDRVPSTINGIPTDVISVGDINAFARPTVCGVSVGHFAITAGTLGCLVRRRGIGIGDHFILSNNHVLANSTSAADGTTPPLGDAILEPGPLDGGDPADPIGELTAWEPITFTGTNVMDAAIARVLDLSDVLPDINKIGRVANPPVAASLYQSVRKHGRTTLHTVGVIMDVSADIRVRYGTQLASFEDQVGIVGVGGDFSRGGDSGSLIVDAVRLNPVALLFAGGGGMTFGSPIQPVLDRFDVDIL